MIVVKKTCKNSPHTHVFRYGHKLGLLCSIGPDGRTVILAATLLINETKEAFNWAFKQFKQHFTSPRTMFTDGDPHMAWAIKEVFQDCKHNLCTYHLSQNVITHCKYAFVDQDDWKRFIGAWWTLAKNSDASLENRFDVEWKKRMDMLPNTPRTTKARAWLQNSMYEKRRQWAACWTWQDWSGGIHSTQRSESMHSHIKEHIIKLSMLKDLVAHIEDFHKHFTVLNEATAECRALKQHASNKVKVHPLIKSARNKKKVTPFAVSIMMAQQFEMNQYTCEECEHDKSDEGKGHALAQALHGCCITGCTMSMNAMGITEDEVNNGTKKHPGVAGTSCRYCGDAFHPACAKHVYNTTDDKWCGQCKHKALIPYKVTRVRDEDNTHAGYIAPANRDYAFGNAVKDESCQYTTCTTCTCQFLTCFGLPCRHMMRVYDMHQLKEFFGDAIYPFWKPINITAARYEPLKKFV